MLHEARRWAFETLAGLEFVFAGFAVAALVAWRLGYFTDTRRLVGLGALHVLGGLLGGLLVVVASGVVYLLVAVGAGIDQRRAERDLDMDPWSPYW